MSEVSRIDENKAVLDKLRPFEGDMLRQLKAYFRVGLTWSSNALEGNTLTITETKVILEDGLTVGGHPLRELYEVTGHGEAYDFMYSLISANAITTADIKALHRLFYEAIDKPNAGSWRKNEIIVTGTDFVFPRPAELELLMQDLEKWATTQSSLHPVEFAAMLHLKFVTIHPFTDGNGRLARLITNLALLQHKYTLCIIPPVLRTEYIDAIKHYQIRDNAAPFCELIAECVHETQLDLRRLFHAV